MNTSENLPGWPTKGEPITTPSGLQFFDVETGDGDRPDSPKSRVRVHYTGWLTNGKKFDSSHDHGGPAEFRLNQVISGWTEGVGSMRAGGKRKLIIPWSLGYGASGNGPIPPKATLIFDVELLEIVA